MSSYCTLTDVQVQSFLERGYLVVRGCLDLDIAQRWMASAYQRLGYDPHDPSTWAEEIVWMHHESELPIRTVAPRAWHAIVDVVGGEYRLETKILRVPQNL